MFISDLAIKRPVLTVVAMLALSVFHALYDAIGATASSREPVPLEAPATPENVLKAIHELHRSPGR